MLPRYLLINILALFLVCGLVACCKRQPVEQDHCVYVEKDYTGECSEAETRNFLRLIYGDGEKSFEFYPISKEKVLLYVFRGADLKDENGVLYRCYLRRPYVEDIGMTLPSMTKLEVNQTVSTVDAIVVNVPKGLKITIGTVLRMDWDGIEYTVTEVENNRAKALYEYRLRFPLDNPPTYVFAGPLRRFNRASYIPKKDDLGEGWIYEDEAYFKIMISMTDETPAALSTVRKRLDSKNDHCARAAALFVLHRTFCPAIDSIEKFTSDTRSEITKLKEWLQDKDLTRLEEIQKANLAKVGVDIERFDDIKSLKVLIDAIDNDKLTFFQFCGLIEKIIILADGAPLFYHELWYIDRRKELKEFYMKWFDKNAPNLQWDKEQKRFTAKPSAGEQ